MNTIYTSKEDGHEYVVTLVKQLVMLSSANGAGEHILVSDEDLKAKFTREVK